MSIKILVVGGLESDNLEIGNMLSGYNVLTACGCDDAMRQIEEERDISLVLLDLGIPNMDGFKILNTIKDHDRYNNLRIIIITNHNEPGSEAKGLASGAVDYVRKPINSMMLNIRINIQLELLRLEQALGQKLGEQGLTFDVIFNQAPIGIAISHSFEPLTHKRKAFTKINSMFEQITGRTRDEQIKMGWASFTHPDDVEEDLDNYKRLRSGEIDSYSMEKRYIKPDGSIVWVYMIVAALHLSNNKKYNHICLVQDITKQKEVEAELLESERSKSVLLSHLPGLAYRCNYDTDWTMQYVSDGCFELTGYATKSLLYNKDLSYKDLIAPKYRKPLWDEWRHILAIRLPFKYEYEIITAKGERKWVLEMGQGIYSEHGEVEALEGIVLDISDRKEIENNLRYNNEHDKLTGLYNRDYLESLLFSDNEKHLTEKRAVVSINLSAMQRLNTTYGFHYTQDLIKTTADTLSRYCTDKCFLFNTYENRFVFYLKGYKDKDKLIEFCETIGNTLESLLTIERIGGGIGVLEIEGDNDTDIDLLMKRLLITSERAFEIYDKEFGVCFYDAEIEEQINREQDIKRELSEIATGDKEGLFLQYQPILNVKTNRICGFEALARLNSDKLGLISPLDFIPIAEKTKLIFSIGQKVFVEAFSFLKKLKENGFGEISVSVNVSVIQLLRKGFIDGLFETVKEMQVSPQNIGIEITESVFASNYDEINRIIGELKDFGIHISIDDFGTGYSSLARERELNVNCLKIDKYFVDNLLLMETEKKIIGDIVSMAHKLGHCTVAEGVENEEQRQYLISCGCDKIQGYLVSKPLDEKAAIEFLENTIYQYNKSSRQ